MRDKKKSLSLWLKQQRMECVVFMCWFCQNILNISMCFCWLSCHCGSNSAFLTEWDARFWPALVQVMACKRVAKGAMNSKDICESLKSGSLCVWRLKTSLPLASHRSALYIVYSYGKPTFVFTILILLFSWIMIVRKAPCTILRLVAIMTAD